MTTTQKIIWSFVITVLLVAILFAGFWFNQSVNKNNETADRTTVVTPTSTPPTPEAKTSGFGSSAEPSVSYDKDGVSISFNWADITVTPRFDLMIGPVTHTALSPGKQFLYVATGQGGGIASFIYDPSTKTAHYIENAHDVGKWLDNGRWEVTNFENYGKTPNKIVSMYRSFSTEEPWKVSRVK